MGGWDDAAYYEQEAAYEAMVDSHKVPIRRWPSSPPRLFLPERRKSAKIHAQLGGIRGIPDELLLD
jgi:hypothetical protein